MRCKTVEINGETFTLTELGAYGFSVGVRQWRREYDKNHFIVKTVGLPFQKNLFYFPHTPIVIDDIYAYKFSRHSDIRVLDMPIKFAGSNDYKLPKELNQFDEVIAKAISFEHEINPGVKDYYAYLTIDQGNVPAGKHQRKPGCHVNGFQGARHRVKRPVCRSYLAYDRIPPVFYPQYFATYHLNEDLHNFFLSFEEQSDPIAAVTYDPYQIICTTAYTVHKSDTADTPLYRTFFRLTYDTIIYDRIGNTHNPLYHYKWPMVAREGRRLLGHKPMPKFHPDAV